MESEALRAVCPDCKKEYDFYADPSAADSASLFPEARRASDGPLLRRCFACSFRKSRWDPLWIPALLLVVATVPLTWMVWWAIAGHFLVLSVVVYPVWRQYRKRSRRVDARSWRFPRMPDRPRSLP